MLSVVNVGEVADIQTVYQGEKYLRIFYVKVALEVACIFHCKDYFLFAQVILAEYIQAELFEISVETGCDLAYLTFNDTSQRKCK